MTDIGYILLTVLVHELGHIVAAKILGVKLTWKLEKFRPVFSYEADTPWKGRVIAQAGWLCEIAGMLCFPLAYQATAVFRFLVYPWYAGKYNDFRGMSQ